MTRCFLLALFIAGCVLRSHGQPPKDLRETVLKDTCTFSPTGRNDYFILEPGYQLILEGKDHGKISRLEITVLNETKKVRGVETRVVEERETVGDELAELSRNFFAYCREANTIFYYGEEVDIYKNGIIVGHEGAWLAEGKNKPGMIMPGDLRLGTKYYQENAPGIAMDKAEVISFGNAVQTPAGIFTNCLKTKETTALNASEKEFKFYAAGVGLVKEENLLLVKYGFVK